MIKKVAKEFCLKTALHGYKFIALPRRILLERFVWIVICAVSLIAATTFIILDWLKIQDTKVVTVTESNHYPVWHYFFPAVTVCNIKSISREGAKRLAEKFKKTSNKKGQFDINLLKYMNTLTSENIYNDDLWVKLKQLQDILDKNNITVHSAMQELTYKCEDYLIRCIWKGQDVRCGSIFEMTKTSSGFCCSFNYHALKNHTFQGLMAYKAPKEPRRVSSCGYLAGLEVMVDNGRDDDYLASLIPSLGYKVMLHSPFNFPDWNTITSLISKKTVNFISINPKLTYCTEYVSNIPVQKRFCWFQKDKKLTYFKFYTYNNCMVECRLKLTLELCQCFPLFGFPTNYVYPKFGRICNLLDIPCLSKYSNHIKSSVPGYNLSDMEPNSEYENEKGVCHCLPDCEMTTYIARNSYGTLNRKFSMNNRPLYTGVKLTNHSVFRIFFNDLVGIKNRRDVEYDWKTTLAYYGGILGFFMGFSFISGMEIIYFLVVRPFTNQNSNKVIRLKKNYYSQPSENICTKNNDEEFK